MDPNTTSTSTIHTPSSVLAPTLTIEEKEDSTISRAGQIFDKVKNEGWSWDWGKICGITCGVTFTVVAASVLLSPVVTLGLMALGMVSTDYLVPALIGTGISLCMLCACDSSPTYRLSDTMT